MRVVRHQEDLELVERVIAEEDGAWDDLSTRVAPAVEGSLKRALLRWGGLGGDLGADPADLRQSLNEKLLGKSFAVLRAYRGDARLTTWLHTVASRHFHRELARLAAERRRQAGGESAEARVESAPDPWDSPETTGLRKEQISAVRQILGDLPEPDQALLKLLVDDEAPARVVAQTLGISPDGVRMRKMRLLRKLRDELAGLWP